MFRCQATGQALREDIAIRDCGDAARAGGPTGGHGRCGCARPVAQTRISSSGADALDACSSCSMTRTGVCSTARRLPRSSLADADRASPARAQRGGGRCSVGRRAVRGPRAIAAAPCSCREEYLDAQWISGPGSTMRPRVRSVQFWDGCSFGGASRSASRLDVLRADTPISGAPRHVGRPGPRAPMACHRREARRARQLPPPGVDGGASRTCECRPRRDRTARSRRRERRGAVSRDRLAHLAVFTPAGGTPLRRTGSGAVAT